VLVFDGRLHYYEARSWRPVLTPIHIAMAIRARVLIVTSAAGAIADELAPGGLMAVRDHVDWTRPRSWLGPGPGALGSARASPYSARFLCLLTRAARDLGIDLRPGIYAAVTGPTYETPAEIRALRAWGADAVGMSTAREVSEAHALGLECAGVSCITNRAAGIDTATLEHHGVLASARAASHRLGLLLEYFLEHLDSDVASSPNATQS
jgi:purine-nucleoside phosphorylase